VLPVLANRIDCLLPLLSAPGQPMPPSMKEALRTLYFDLAGAPVPKLLGACPGRRPRAHPVRQRLAVHPDRGLRRAGGADRHHPLLAEPLRTAVLSGNAARLFPALVAAAR